MSYSDEQWNNVVAFLNDEAEKAPPDGIGKTIDTIEEFIQMVRTVEAIKASIVDSNANRAREFANLERAKAANAKAARAIQDRAERDGYSAAAARVIVYV